jgi:protein phosphatase
MRPRKCSYGARTDVGCVRDHNEDAYGAWPKKGLFAVTDGMGGHAAGEVASEMTIQAVGEVVERYVLADDADPAAVLQEALQTANKEVFDRAAREPERANMGCTAAVIWVMMDKYAIAHVGDSRIYRMRRGRLEALTKDHSYVQELVDRGTITPEEAATHSQRNVITRAIGGNSTVETDTSTGDLEPGDTFLLCTDGLCGVVSEAEAEKRVASARRLQSLCEALVEDARKAGGPDNVTVAAVRPHFDLSARTAHGVERALPFLARLLREAMGMTRRAIQRESSL